MNIGKEQIAHKKQIGKVGDSPVMEVVTKGGYHLVVAVKGSKAETLGVGPHRKVARHIAMRREPDLQITELSKSDDLDVSHFEHLLAKYEQMTDEFNQEDPAE